MMRIFSKYICHSVLDTESREKSLKDWITASAGMTKRLLLIRFSSILLLIAFALLAGCATTTPLMSAASSGDINTVKNLLDKGADVNAKDDIGRTALSEAAGNGYTEIVKLLIDKGADVNAKSSGGWTALMSAAMGGHTEIVKLLIDKGADVNAKNDIGRTALMRAAMGGHTEIVKLLIDKGTDVNAKGYALDGNGKFFSYWTALSEAAGNGHTEIVKLLIDKGADVNAKDNFGLTTLMRAAMGGHTETVKLLIDKGADVNAKNNLGDGDDGDTALTQAARRGHTKIVKLLIDKGADVNAKNNLGNTALMHAAKYNHIGIVKLLIDKGVDIDDAITMLERSGDVSGTAGAKLLESMRPKQQIASPTQSQGISKEELKTIVQSAVEGTIQAQKQETKVTPSIQSNIDKPSFNTAEKIMGEHDLAVIIGIEGYQGIPKSDYSYDDAKLMADYVKALGFKSRNIELLTDEKATKSSIEKTLEAWLKNKAKPDSRVFIYYSGHGAPEPKTGDAYLVPYDGDPNYLEVTGYSLKRLYDSLGKLQVAEITVVLDSCFSGAGGRSVLAKGARPLVMTTTALSIPSNMAILSATQGTQISTSSTEKGHGVFTYYFLKALKDGKKNIAEIYEYIKPLVEDEAKQLNVQQSPNISPDVEKLKGRFGLRK